MVKVLLENREIGVIKFLELTEEQLRLLKMLGNEGWLDKSSEYEIFAEEFKFERV